MVTVRPFESITVKKYHFFVYDRCATRQTRVALFSSFLAEGESKPYFTCHNLCQLSPRHVWMRKFSPSRLIFARESMNQVTCPISLEKVSSMNKIAILNVEKKKKRKKKVKNNTIFHFFLFSIVSLLILKITRLKISKDSICTRIANCIRR